MYDPWMTYGTKGHFILQALVEGTKDSSNLISWEWKFVLCTFILQRPKDNTIQNTYMVTIFMSFSTKSFAGGRKFLHDINDNLDSPWEDKPFFPNLYKLHNLYTLMDFHLVLLRGVCLKSSQPNDCSIKRPWGIYPISRFFDLLQI
jgi:hypothetical protein